MSERPTGTVSFLFTDIEGSTRLWEQHPKAMKAALARHDEILRSAIEDHDGYVFSTAGDAFSAAFPRAQDAVSAALAAQRTLVGEDWGDLAIGVRMALHTGEADERDGDYFGSAVNRTARLLSAAHGGQMLVSHTVQEIVEHQLAEAVGLVDLGEHRLRDLGRPEHVFQLTHSALPAEFPPLLSLDVRPSNLPPERTSLFGREEDVREAVALLADGRLLTLTGIGGVGKTRLARRIATQVIDSYRDGTWLVELASLSDRDAVPGEVLKSLQVPEQVGRPVLDTLLDRLEHGERLLVWDNCEHLIEAVALLADAVLEGCPHVRILATSREPLRVEGERIYQVPPLESPVADADLEAIRQSPGVRLFEERAADRVAGFSITERNAASVAQICQRLDGIPLGIELAAARITSMSPDDIATGLDDRFELLTAGIRTALPRHRTLEAAFDWSYRLLSTPQQILLGRLSVFAGSFTAQAARDICSGEEVTADSVGGLLSGLVDKSLIGLQATSEESRYLLHETVKQYASRQLAAREEPGQLKARFRNWYLALAEEGEHRTVQRFGRWHQRFTDEYDNLREAFLLCLDAGDGDRALRLASSMSFFQANIGHVPECRRWLELALPLARTAGAKEKTLAKGLLSLGANGWIDADNRWTEPLLLEALGIYERLVHLPGMVWSRYWLSVAACHRGEFREAIEYAETALTIAEEKRQKALAGLPLDPLTAALLNQQLTEGSLLPKPKFNELADTLSKAITLAERDGLEVEKALLTHRLGLATAAAGDPETGLGLCEDSLSYLGEGGPGVPFGGVLIGTAQVALLAGEHSKAKTLATDGLEVCNTQGYGAGAIEGIYLLGAIASIEGQAARAATLFSIQPSRRHGTLFFMPLDLSKYERQAQNSLPVSSRGQAKKTGESLRLDQAVAYALNSQDS